MKEIALNTQTTQHTQTMTSLEIAELTGKQHKDVLKAIRNMEPGWTKVAGRKFALGSYKDLNGQLRPCYQLTKTECLYIATKFKVHTGTDPLCTLEQKKSLEFQEKLKNIFD